ncbi:MAG: peptidoglycan DD-metalloendopeptidase family protein [Bacteroidetes bacterium]|nr:peptidoglycan DD-metalloendopeptidase family protein [Bacteroidota bacterium]
MICKKDKKYWGIILIMWILMLGGECFGQTRKELEEERSKTMREIELTNIILEKTEKSRKQSLNQLIILRRRIEKRNKYVNTLEEEIILVDGKIKENNWVMNSLENDLEKIKKEYERIIIGSYKKSKNQDNIIYILASKNYGEAYRRIKYYKQLVAYRKKQAKKIIAINIILDLKEVELEEERDKKQDLLSIRKTEKEKLNVEKDRKNKMVISLGKKEKKLRNEIKTRERISRELEKEITRIIQEEREREKGRGIMKLTPEEENIAINFSSNKGKLPWPTERGIIIEKFGEHKHAVLKNVKINNNGIDIATTEKAEIRAIFEGEVRKIVAIKGANNTVLIKHGNFFSVYQNLVEVNVKKGEKVKTKQKIGIVYSNNESERDNIIHLEIWENNVKMNPETWIAK